jgi:hypothetical protein
VTIFLYANCVVAAGVILCAGCTIAAVKGFTDACYKGEKGVAEGVTCPKDRKDI